MQNHGEEGALFNHSSIHCEYRYTEDAPPVFFHAETNAWIFLKWILFGNCFSFPGYVACHYLAAVIYLVGFFILSFSLLKHIVGEL